MTNANTLLNFDDQENEVSGLLHAVDAVMHLIPDCDNKEILRNRIEAFNTTATLSFSLEDIERKKSEFPEDCPLSEDEKLQALRNLREEEDFDTVFCNTVRTLIAVKLINKAADKFADTLLLEIQTDENDPENYLTRQEAEKLAHCKNEHEWNFFCDSIKSKRNNKYPNTWFDQIVKSGKLEKLHRSWGLYRMLNSAISN